MKGSVPVGPNGRLQASLSDAFSLECTFDNSVCFVLADENNCDIYYVDESIEKTLRICSWNKGLQ